MLGRGAPCFRGGAHNLSAVFAHLDEEAPIGWSWKAYETLSPSPTKITVWSAPPTGYQEEVGKIWMVTGDDGITHVYMYRVDDFFDEETGQQDDLDGLTSAELWGDSIPIAYSVSPGGARVDYRYEIDRDGERVTSFLPESLEYVGAGDDGPTQHVAFGYEVRPDLLLAGEAGFGASDVILEVLDRRLASVAFLGDDGGYGVKRTVFLSYEEGETGRSRLATVKECAGADETVCKPATAFAYSDFEPGGFGFNLVADGGTLASPSELHRGLWTGDFTGDGLTDVAYVDYEHAFSAGLYVFPSESTGGFGERELVAGPWPIVDGSSIQDLRVVPIDPNADGQLDFVYHMKAGDPIMMAARANDLGAWGNHIVCEGDCSEAVFFEPTADLGGAAKLAICRPQSSPEGCKNNGLFTLDLVSAPLPINDDFDRVYGRNNATEDSYPGACGPRMRRTAVPASRGSTVEYTEYDVCYDGTITEEQCTGGEKLWYEFTPEFEEGFGDNTWWVGSCRHGVKRTRGHGGVSFPEVHGIPDVHGDFDGDGLTDVLRYKEDDPLFGENELILSSGGHWNCPEKVDTLVHAARAAPGWC